MTSDRLVKPSFPGYGVRAELPATGTWVRRYAAVEERSGLDVELRLLDAPTGGPAGAPGRFRSDLAAIFTRGSPFVAEVLDAGVAWGRLFYVTELRDAVAVTELLDDAGGRLEIGEAFRMGAEVLAGLGYLHGHGLLVQCLDPNSILLDRASGHYLLADFSLAKKLGAPSPTRAAERPYEELPMPPEGNVSCELDLRADLFLLGATLYQAFTGLDPRPGLAGPILEMRDTRVEPASTLRPGLLRSLDELLACSLSFEPAARPASASEMAAALARVHDAMRGK